MARYDHLQLVRLPELFERRKRPGFGAQPTRDLAEHGTRLREELDAAIAAQQRRRKPEFIDPSLILRVQMSGSSSKSNGRRSASRSYPATPIAPSYSSPRMTKCATSEPG